MKWYIHRILILFCSLFAMGVIFDNTGIATIYACDIEDEVDNWDLSDFDYDDEIHDGHDEDGNMTGLFGYECVGDSPNDDDDDYNYNDYDDYYDDWDGDPCEMGDCDDLYDDTADNDISKEEIDEDDCVLATGMQSIARRIKGKEECVQDCMGVLGGKAYTKVCNGETICIDGNNGTFTNTLTGEALEKFEQAEQEMLQNCLQAALLNSLNENYGIQIDYSASQRTPGSFNPCNYSIVFNSISAISVYSVTAELFHAYQEQYLEGLLSDIQNSVDHTGGSNIEAEEKAMGYLSSKFFFLNNKGIEGVPPLLIQWCEQFAEKNKNNHSNATLTTDEIASWFAAVDEFQQYYAGSSESYGNDMYGSPVDYDLLPSSLLNLWNMAKNCTEMEIIVKPRNKFRIYEQAIKW